MSALGVGPKQLPVLAVLMIVLIAAVAVTVVRISPSAPPEPASKPAQERQEAGLSREPEAPMISSSRNPFKAPESFKPLSEDPQPGPGMAPQVPPGPSSGVSVQPIDLSGKLGSVPSSSPAPQEPGGEPQAKPSFTLLATIKGSKGLSAVIKAGDSKVSIVNVGDKLEGGYRVLKLEASRAVLTNGRDTTIAKRPRS